MASTKLSDFLKEVMNYTWEEFVKAEKSKQFSTTQSIVFALVRSCAMENINAIRIALNRLDGKLKTPVKIEVPRVYYLFPYAQITAGENAQDTQVAGYPHVDKPVEAPTDTSVPAIEGDIIPKHENQQETDSKEDSAEERLLKMSLRETLNKMSDYPREVPAAIAKRALEVEQAIRNRTPLPDDIPLVKSVVAAHLLIMAQKRDIEALYEAFDQIEGKLTETIQVLGEDIYITSYSSVAPPGARLNADGILQLEATDAQAVWAEKLKGRIQ